jgi:hypothetical protein
MKLWPVIVAIAERSWLIRNGKLVSAPIRNRAACGCMTAIPQFWIRMPVQSRTKVSNANNTTMRVRKTLRQSRVEKRKRFFKLLWNAVQPRSLFSQTSDVMLA